VVETESDALLLEDSLIKKFKPRYNILLKDDKSYASIVIKNEPFPRVLSTRQILDDGSTYFGPYTSGRSLYSILDLIKELYPLRSCTLNLSKANIQAKKFKVCLEYHLGNCLGPCVGKQREEDYQQGIQHIKRIIKGEYLEAVKNLKKEMLQLASEQKFEQAQQVQLKGGNVQAIPDVVRSTVISSLRTQQAEVARKEADLAARYSETYPLVVNARARVDNEEHAVGVRDGLAYPLVLQVLVLQVELEQEDGREVFVAARLDVELAGGLQPLHVWSQPGAQCQRCTP
jgi:excinuclease ABC subunit C